MGDLDDMLTPFGEGRLLWLFGVSVMVGVVIVAGVATAMLSVKAAV